MSIFSSVCSICPNHGPFGKALPLSCVPCPVRWRFGLPALCTLGILDSILCSRLHFSPPLRSGAHLTPNLQVSSAIFASWWLIPFSQVLTWTSLCSFLVCRWLSSLSNHPVPIHISLPHSGIWDISAIRHLNQLLFQDFCFNHYYSSLWASQVAHWVKDLPAMQEMQAVVGSIPGSEILWKRAWQPTPVFLPEKFHGQRSLAGYSPWGQKRAGHNLATKQQPEVDHMVKKV